MLKADGKRLKRAVVPEDFKVANTVKIYQRKGNNSCYGNYRGIPLLATAGKLLAKILNNSPVQIVDRLTPPSQSGWRVGTTNSSVWQWNVDLVPSIGDAAQDVPAEAGAQKARHSLGWLCIKRWGVGENRFGPDWGDGWVTFAEWTSTNSLKLPFMVSWREGIATRADRKRDIRTMFVCYLRKREFSQTGNSWPMTEGNGGKEFPIMGWLQRLGASAKTGNSNVTNANARSFPK